MLLVHRQTRRTRVQAIVRMLGASGLTMCIAFGLVLRFSLAPETAVACCVSTTISNDLRWHAPQTHFG